MVTASDLVSLVECPRDAMQGWKPFIATEKKAKYINALLNVGFHTIDFGSFVSPKAIPQMADTSEVVKRLSKSPRGTKLLAIVANLRGAAEALVFDQIDQLGFPFSISPTFQLRNAHATIAGSLEIVEDIQNLCAKNGKELVVYISMGFGNPYGDPYDLSLVGEWVEKIGSLGVGVISIADTVGIATPAQVGAVLNSVIPHHPGTSIGVHLHSTGANWQEKLDAAVAAGCRRFDGALKGIGGCPMANDELVGNMNSEWMVPYFGERGLLPEIDHDALAACTAMAAEIFQTFPI